MKRYRLLKECYEQAKKGAREAGFTIMPYYKFLIWNYFSKQ